MSSNYFLDIIKRLISGRKFENQIQSKLDVLDSMEFDKLYVENVRQFFDTTTKMAKYYCDLGVKNNIFDRFVGYLCDNEDCRRILYSTKDQDYDILNEEYKKCEVCESLEREDVEFKLNNLDKIIFYKFTESYERQP